MKVFVSGSIKDKGRIQAIFAQLEQAGHTVTHDWTKTDELADKLKQKTEAGQRAKADIDGVLAADAYILISDNETQGKGMYAELGAALALNETTGKPKLFVVGPLNHASIFYFHPAVEYHQTIDQVLRKLV